MTDDRYSDIMCVFPDKIRYMLNNVPDFSMVSEIRLRAGGALCVTGGTSTCYLREAGYSFVSDENAYIVTANDINGVLEKCCGYSAYAHEDELKSGFLTIGKGHRIGIAGNLSSGGIAGASSLCIRIAREYPQAADVLIDRVYRGRLPGVIIAGAPGTGKTTMLRAAAGVLACGKNGRAYRTAVIDERYELAGRNGSAFSLCRYADIIGGCSKAEGILRAVRLLSPELIVCDEVGSLEETESISSVMGSGVKFLVSIHASSPQELEKNKRFRVLTETGAFDFAVFLSSYGRIEKIQRIGGNCDEIYCGGTRVHGAVRMGLIQSGGT